VEKPSNQRTGVVQPLKQLFKIKAGNDERGADVMRAVKRPAEIETMLL